MADTENPVFTLLSVSLTRDGAQAEVDREKNSIAGACVFTESCPACFTCNFEATAGTFTSTTVSFTYCITLGWIHMLYASSAASMSGSPCVPSYHITALWQVSHTSQVGFYHTDTAVSYCSSPVHYSADLYFIFCHSSINNLSLRFPLSYIYTRDRGCKLASARPPTYITSVAFLRVTIFMCTGSVNKHIQ